MADRFLWKKKVPRNRSENQPSASYGATLHPVDLDRYTMAIIACSERGATLTQIIVDLAISPATYQSYYSGQIKQVVARSIDGRNVRFPANILQHVIAHDGVYGRFCIEFDASGRFQTIERIL